MKRVWPITAMCMCFWGCGSNEPGTTAASGTGTMGTGSSSASGAGGGVSAVPCEGAPADPSLAGTWVASGKLAIKLKGAPGGAITICPEDQIGEATMLLLLSVKSDPADASKLTEVRANLCSIELPTVSALVGSCDPKSQSLVYTQIIAPQAFLNALPGIQAEPVAGAVTGKGSGASVALDRLNLVIGATAKDGVLPKWNEATAGCASASLGHSNVCEAACVSDCSALRDDDADTYPAVTLEVCGLTAGDQKSGVPCHAAKPDDPGATIQGRTFMDFQVDPQFKGTVKSSCEVLGTIDTGIHYAVLGADLVLAGSPLTVAQTIKSLPTFDVDPAQSKFRMVRIDGAYGAPDWAVDATKADAACATLLKRVNEL